MSNSILFTMHDIYLLVKKNYIFVLKFSIGFLLAGIFYTLFSTKYYASYISINPQNNTTQEINTAVSLMLGYDGASNSNSTFRITDVLDSKRLKLDIVNKSWKTNAFQDSVNLIEYWEIETEESNSLNIDSHRFLEEKAVDKLKNNLYIYEEETGLIKIRVLMEEPQLSADIANYIADFIKNYIGNDLTSKSTEYRLFVENRLKTIQSQLDAASDKLHAFEIEHPIVPTELNKKYQKLIMEVEKQRHLDLFYSELVEKAITEEQYEKPIFDLLDYPALPVPEPYWPNNGLIYLLSLFAGFMVSVIILTSSKSLSNKL